MLLIEQINMLGPNNLIITGLMGTGKTTVGKLVAAKLGREFIDTDEYINENVGSASHILSQPNGDVHFRLVEEQVASELASRKGLVISTGGRFLISQSNIDAMSQTGHIICLVANLDEIVIRLLSSSTDTYRPRFEAAKSKIELMIKLQEQSRPFYSQFYQFNTSGVKPEEVADEIVRWVLSMQTEV